MKKQIDIKIDKINQSKIPIVAIDSSLDKYQDQILFPKKLALAEEKLKGVQLPRVGKSVN